MTRPAHLFAAVLATLLASAPALADGANLSAAPPEGSPGTAQHLILAQRTWGQALTTGDVLQMLVAIRLARGATGRVKFIKFEGFF